MIRCPEAITHTVYKKEFTKDRPITDTAEYNSESKIFLNR